MNILKNPPGIWGEDDTFKLAYFHTDVLQHPRIPDLGKYRSVRLHDVDVLISLMVVAIA